MKLCIDTTDQTETKVILTKEEKIMNEVVLTREKRSQVVLEAISENLKSQQVTFEDIDELEVALGPGSFTGVRVGVSVANTLQFLLGIPLNGKLRSVEPVYE
ncbi:tRNA (adenosine(37)-N6)-threonylcarbamoyltransferase complex dimerization subunit type 1 TsaB [Candidatus Gottesmanbacteria bacterium]|nr:tRNA (adenosine(37)-N6)-threonylcarbamoyltransferase complex dimerization subunit type 1 TsaB [Candidatus Gottesmanbacteria bacterium]